MSFVIVQVAGQGAFVVIKLRLTRPTNTNELMDAIEIQQFPRTR